MSVSLVTVTWSVEDMALAGVTGSITFTLSQPVTDTSTGNVYLPSPSRNYPFTGVPGESDALIANDSPSLNPQGTYYIVTIAGNTASYTYNVALDHADGATQTLGTLLENQVQPVTQYAQYLQLPSGGPPSAGEVPVATGTGTQVQWGPAGAGGSGFPASPVVTGTPVAGQVLTATSASAATWETPAGGGGSGTVTSVTAGDASITVGGTAAAPTVETGTLDKIASLHPAAAAVGFNGQKATGLANGSASTDAVAFGQLGTAAFSASSSFDASGAAAAAQSAAEAASLPLPSGTATAGYVPVATGSGSATTWQAVSGGGTSGNIDGGSATTGQLPVGVIDGGNA